MDFILKFSIMKGIESFFADLRYLSLNKLSYRTLTNSNFPIETINFIPESFSARCAGFVSL